MHDKLHTSAWQGRTWLLGVGQDRVTAQGPSSSAANGYFYTRETTDSPVGITTNLSEPVAYKPPPGDIILSVPQRE
jgi:hypothetical protein